MLAAALQALLQGLHLRLEIVEEVVVEEPATRDVHAEVALEVQEQLVEATLHVLGQAGPAAQEGLRRSGAARILTGARRRRRRAAIAAALERFGAAAFDLPHQASGAPLHLGIGVLCRSRAQLRQGRFAHRPQRLLGPRAIAEAVAAEIADPLVEIRGGGFLRRGAVLLARNGFLRRQAAGRRRHESQQGQPSPLHRRLHQGVCAWSKRGPPPDEVRAAKTPTATGARWDGEACA